MRTETPGRRRRRGERAVREGLAPSTGLRHRRVRVTPGTVDETAGPGRSAARSELDCREPFGDGCGRQRPVATRRPSSSSPALPPDSPPTCGRPRACAGASRAPRPYADAPRLPEGAAVDLRAVARGEWTELEIGPGRGWFLVERAAVEPRAALVGLEYPPQVGRDCRRAPLPAGLGPRARVFAEDAGHALPRLTPDASVRRVFVHFPDPWWKKRHQNPRLHLLLGEAARYRRCRSRYRTGA